MKKILTVSIVSILATVVFAQTITKSGNLNFSRVSHESQVLPDGRVLVMGGDDNAAVTKPVVYSSCEIYNPQTGVWSMTTSMNFPRTDFASVVLNDGRVMVIGGRDSDYNMYKSCEIYDPVTKIWSIVAEMHDERTKHEVIKLKNGKILVVGAAQSTYMTEIYDPYLNKWCLSGDLKGATTSTNGFTLNLLKDNNVIYISSYYIQIFNTSTNIWTKVPGMLKYSRMNHSAVVMNNGNVLIIGSTNQNANKKVEIYNPVSNTITETGSLSFEKSYGNAVLLDDGRVLTMGFGDAVSPTDTKIIEIFNPSTGTWTHSLYNELGTFDYSMNKLNDGRVLVTAGGYPGVSTKGSILIETDNLSQCTYDQVSLSATNNSVCIGNDAQLVIDNPENNVEYTAMLGNQNIGSFSGSSSPQILKVLSNHLSSGENLISVNAQKSGCYSTKLNTEITITTSYTFNDSVFITQPDTVICWNSSIPIIAKSVSGIDSIIWNNGNADDTLLNAIRFTYYANSINTDGCYSKPSNLVEVSFLPVATSSDVTVGNSEFVCENDDIITLTTGKPVGGFWSGNGIVGKDMLDYSALVSGYNYIKYNYCGFEKSTFKYITGLPDTTSNFKVTTDDNMCEGRDFKITISASATNAKYNIYVNNVLRNVLSGNGLTISLAINYLTPNSVIKVVEQFQNQCFTIRTDSVEIHPKIFPIPKPELVGITLERDTICNSSELNFSLNNTDTTIKYFISYGSTKTYFSTQNDSVWYAKYQIPKYYFSNNNDPIAGFSNVISLNGMNEVGCLAKTSKDLPYWIFNNIIDFNVSNTGSIVDDIVEIQNKSNGDNYRWEFDPSLDIIEQSAYSAKVTSHTTGVFGIKLLSESRFGCVDTLVKKVSFMNEYKNGVVNNVCNSALIRDFDGNNMRDGELLHVDKDGNMMFYKSFRYYYEDCFAIYKVNPQGVTLWYLDNKGCESYLKSSQMDSAGNLYICGLVEYGSLFNIKTMGWALYGSNSYVAKINPDGKVLWIMASYSDEGPGPGKIRLLNDSTLLYESSYLFKGIFYCAGREYPVDKTSNTFLINTNTGFVNVIPGNTNLKNGIVQVSDNVKSYNVMPVDYYNKKEHAYFTVQSYLYTNGKLIFDMIKFNSTANSFQKVSSIEFEPTSDELVAVPYSAYLTISYDSVYNEYYKKNFNLLAKFDSTGKLLWEFNSDSIHATLSSFCVVEGEVYAVGSFDDYISLNNGLAGDFGVSEKGGNKLFLIKLDRDGKVAGINVFGSHGMNSVSKLLYFNGEFVIQGNSLSDLYFDDKLLDHCVYSDFVVKVSLNNCVSKKDSYSPDYTPDIIWDINDNKTSGITATNLFLDDNKDVYVSYVHSGYEGVVPVRYDYISKFSKQGKKLWSHVLISKDSYSKKADIVNNQIVFYLFAGDVTIDSVNYALQSNSSQAAYFDTAGVFQYFKTFSDTIITSEKDKKCLEIKNKYKGFDISDLNCNNIRLDDDNSLFVLNYEYLNSRVNNYGNVGFSKYSEKGLINYKREFPIVALSTSFIEIDGLNNYIYLLTNFSNSYSSNNIFQNITAGIHLFQIKDTDFVCNEYNKPEFPITPSSVSICKGDTASVNIPYIYDNCSFISENVQTIRHMDKFYVTSDVPGYCSIALQDTATGCYSDYDTVKINIYPPITIDFGITDTEFNYDEVARLNITNPELVSFKWSPDSIFDDPTIRNPSVDFYYALYGYSKFVYVKAIDIHGCENNGTIRLWVVDPVSVETVDKDGMNVFPNPAHSKVFVDVPLGCDELIISDDLGRIVYSAKIVNNSNDIGIGNLSQGIYYVQAKYKDRVLTKKLIVE